jgi:HrpA-like RNA helicase
MTVGRRIAEELGEPVGRTVGVKIRFQDSTSAQTRIKLMTDGILLAEAQSDHYFNRYDTLIVDEAHERSLNIDFILGLLKQALRRRRDLRVIITSATIDTEKFALLSATRPSSTCRAACTRCRRATWKRKMKMARMRPMWTRRCSALDRLLQERRRGDILIFMPTEQDIRDTCELIRGRRYRRDGSHSAFRAFVRRRTAAGIRTGQGTQNYRGHQRRRDLHHHPGHSLCDRHRSCADQPIHAALAHQHPARGSDFAKQRRPASRPLRPGGQRHLHPPLQ